MMHDQRINKGRDKGSEIFRCIKTIYHLLCLNVLSNLDEGGNIALWTAQPFFRENLEHLLLSPFFFFF